jgi:hypothetical protein
MREYTIDDMLKSVGFESKEQFSGLSEMYFRFGKKWSMECPQTREEKLDYLLKDKEDVL